MGGAQQNAFMNEGGCINRVAETSASWAGLRQKACMLSSKASDACVPPRYCTTLTRQRRRTTTAERLVGPSPQLHSVGVPACPGAGNKWLAVGGGVAQPRQAAAQAVATGHGGAACLPGAAGAPPTIATPAVACSSLHEEHTGRAG